MRTFLLLGMGAGLCILLAGCGSKTEVLAQVGQQTITTQDLDRALANLPETYQPLAQTSKGKHQILENLIKKTLLVQEARNRGFDKEAKVKQQIKEYERKMRARLEQALAEARQRLEAMPRQVFEEVMLTELNTRLKQEQAKQLSVPEADVNVYYEDYARKLKLLNPAAKVPDLPSVDSQIRAILVEEQLIKELEKKSRVHIREDAFGRRYGNVQEEATIQDTPETTP